MIREAMLYERQEGGRVRCHLCSHRCRISDGRFGFCGVRQNRGGTLYTHVYGEVIAADVDPVEKKPLYHFLPGTTTYSIATVGCNFRCGFCQNWTISQAPQEKEETIGGTPLSPGEIVDNALDRGCRSISFTYTEPTIFFEYAHDTARLAHEHGLPTIFVSNGYMTEEALAAIHPWLDACNIDLKSFRDRFYRTTCKARLKPVLDTIERIGKSDIWMELTTLVVPGLNDSPEELRDIARFIAAINPGIPWHIIRFFPAYHSRPDRGHPGWKKSERLTGSGFPRVSIMSIWETSPGIGRCRLPQVLRIVVKGGVAGQPRRSMSTGAGVHSAGGISAGCFHRVPGRPQIHKNLLFASGGWLYRRFQYQHIE